MTISRASGSITFPANFTLIAAMNLCPCGYAGDAELQCTCSAFVVTRYQKWLSGPLIDRIDIHVEAPRVNYDKLAKVSYCVGRKRLSRWTISASSKRRRS